LKGTTTRIGKLFKTEQSTSKMNYKIIQDLQKLQEFIDFLPDLDESKNECFYVALFARKKYFTSSVKIKSDKSQLKRFTASKKTLIQKIRQLECEFGSYQMDGISIPQEALALYITPNPRSKTIAAKKTLIELVHLITSDKTNYCPRAVSMNSIHKSCSRTVFFDFDYDFKDISETIKIIKEKDIINITACNFIQTRGGFHLLVKISDIEPKYSKKWHTGLSSLGSDVEDDEKNLIPVVGCCQGNFIPKLIV
jgi:hypothetical protein